MEDKHLGWGSWEWLCPLHMPPASAGRVTSVSREPHICDGRSTARAGLDSWVTDHRSQRCTIWYIIFIVWSHCDLRVVLCSCYIHPKQCTNQSNETTIASHRAGGTVELSLWCVGGREEHWEVREFLFESHPAGWCWASYLALLSVGFFNEKIRSNITHFVVMIVTIKSPRMEKGFETRGYKCHWLLF